MTKNISKLNIVAQCKVMQTEIDYETDKAKLLEVDRCLYTPKAIGQTLRKYSLTEATWIVSPAGRELWILDGEMAKQLRGIN